MSLKNRILKLSLGAMLTASILSFRFTPQGIEVVKNFDQQKYLGTWYEIARLNYRWEKGLDHVTANYSLNKNGSIRVDNKGFDYTKNKWKQSIGKAKPVDKPTEGKLKVSFFGPFYAEYNIVELDKDYKYALVIGSSTDYMWILSRDKTIPEKIKQAYVAKARELGVQTDKLVWVNQE
ncbi:MAG TPA: lipocalin family protein [Flavobacteriales bacterium]|nr:lipocalin family protein [Flavobacteriales bacterium]